MSEELHQRIGELENRNKILASATKQWEHLQKIYLESHATLLQSEGFVKAIKDRMERALTAGDIAWWDWEYSTGNI